MCRSERWITELSRCPIMSFVGLPCSSAISKPIGIEKNPARAPIQQAERVLNGTGGTGLCTILNERFGTLVYVSLGEPIDQHAGPELNSCTAAPASRSSSATLVPCTLEARTSGCSASRCPDGHIVRQGDLQRHPRGRSAKWRYRKRCVGEARQLAFLHGSLVWSIDEVHQGGFSMSVRC